MHENAILTISARIPHCQTNGQWSLKATLAGGLQANSEARTSHPSSRLLFLCCIDIDFLKSKVRRKAPAEPAVKCTSTTALWIFSTKIYVNKIKIYVKVYVKICVSCPYLKFIFASFRHMQNC